MAEDRIVIGTVRSVNPTRREVRLRPETGVEHLVTKQAWMYSVLTNGRELRAKVLTATPHQTGPIIELGPGTTRDSVAQLKDALVWIPASAWVPPAEDEFRAQHLHGLAVVGESGELLGKVVDVIESPANAVVVIEHAEGRRLLVPVIPEVIVEVDLEEHILRLGDIAPFAVEE